MERSADVLPELWREVGLHGEITEAVERAAPLLRGLFGPGAVAVRAVDPPRGCVETVAAAGLAAPPRTACGPEEMDRLQRWCDAGAVFHGSADAARGRAPGAVPDSTNGEVLLGPLKARHGPPGVLLLVAAPGAPFPADRAALLGELLEPFGVALENDRRLRELRTLREAVEADNRSLLTKLGRHDISDSIVGAESGLRPVMQQVERVAGSDVPVLILGETGSGKEVVARAIHARSRRTGGPFLRVNCGAIPPELVDSELFGHERGSFTGAVGLRAGWFERADRGTLFLDECGELPLAVQVRLLRILQDGTFERVGGERSLQVDVRIVAATHRDLHALVAAGRFREDLWYRLAVFPIELPPLRDRPEDVPALAAHFALRAAKRLGMLPLVPSAEDVRLLVAYPWPGNVRELAAVIERAAILGDGRRLEVARALGSGPPRPSPTVTRTVAEPAGFPTLDEVVVRHVEAALGRTRGRIEGPDGAAALLGVNPHTLRARMRKLGVRWQRFRAKGQEDGGSGDRPRRLAG